MSLRSFDKVKTTLITVQYSINVGVTHKYSCHDIGEVMALVLNLYRAS